MTLTDRQPRAGCAHCQTLGADVACRSCGRTICQVCAASWRSCPTPCAQEMRVGIGRRLRACDARGLRGVVSNFTLRLVAADLERLVVRERAIGRHITTAYWPLVARGQLVELALSSGPQGGYCGLSLHAIDAMDANPEGDVAVGETDSQLPKALVGSEDDSLAAVVRWDERVEIFDLAEARCIARVSEPGAALVTAALNSASDRLFAASWQQLFVFEARTGRRVYGFPLELPQGVGWLGLRARRAVVIGTADGFPRIGRLGASPRAMRVFDLGPAGVPQHSFEPLERLFVRGRGLAAALSGDGRLLAIGDASCSSVADTPGAPLLLVDLDAGHALRVDGHSDAIIYLRWVCDEAGREALVSADADNRVIIWPRVGDGLAPLAAEASPP